MAWTKEQVWQIIQLKAAAYNLEISLFASLLFHESAGGNIYAVKTEDLFYLHKLAPKVRSELTGYVPRDIATEKRMRSISWGLGQLMGDTARWLGFKGEYMPELIDPEINLEYTAKFFRYCLDRVDNDHDALLRYNGGGNPDYPSLVFAVRDNESWKAFIP